MTKAKTPKIAKTVKAKGKFSNRICNLLPSRDVGKDWTFQDSLSSGALTAPAAPPKSVDLRATWWAINNQGGTGSCVGWAAADGVMRYHLTQANRLAKNQMLSPRFVWMASKETDEFTTKPQTFIEEAGTSLKSAMDIVRKYGTALDSELPFDISTNMFIGTESAFYASASTRKAANYFNLGKNISQWKSWLANNGPILAGLSVDATWENAADNAGKLDTFLPNTARGGHAICIVGYTPDRFIIRNSWGTTWGDKGFGYASHSYIKDAFFPESYGVTL